MKKPRAARSTTPITPATAPPITGPDELEPDDDAGDVFVGNTDPSEAVEGAKLDVAGKEISVLEAADVIDVVAEEEEAEAKPLLVTGLRYL